LVIPLDIAPLGLADPDERTTFEVRAGEYRLNVIKPDIQVVEPLSEVRIVVRQVLGRDRFLDSVAEVGQRVSPRGALGQ